MSVDMSEKRKGKTPPKGLGACRVSTVKSARQTETSEYCLEDIRGWIVEGKGDFAKKIKMIRATSDEEKQVELKLTLPGVMFSETFHRRSSKELIQHSGLICMDFDDVEHPAETIDNMRFDPHLALAFVSPRANGVKAVFCIPDDGNHGNAFETVRDYCATMYELQADEACKDVSRLCFLSVDPEAHYAPDALPLRVAPKVEAPKPKKKPTEGDRIGDRYQASSDIWNRSADLLTGVGWKIGRSGGDRTFCTRPGKERGVSGTLWSDGGFYCFSDQAPPLKPSQSYSAFALLTTLSYGGDYKAATKALADEFGDDLRNKSGADFYGKARSAGEGKEYDSGKNKTNLLDLLNASVISEQAQLEILRRNQQEQVEVIPGALLGQATACYMQYNGGKTLTTLRFIADSVEEGRINGNDVYYILADDDFSGAVCKGTLAKEKGFHLVVPSLLENSIAIDQIEPLLDDLAGTGEALGKIFIVDTLKKVCSMMDKRAAAKFGKTVRKFIQNGGTFIALGHINKHKNSEGKPVHEGTGDIVNDFDCVYLGNIDTTIDEANRQVTFRNAKSRGDVPLKFSVKYDAGAKTSWMDKFKSVELINEAEAETREKALEDQQRLEHDLNGVKWIREQLEDGPKVTSAITRADGKPCGIGWKKINNLIHRYSDNHRNRNYRFWTSKAASKNAQLWTLTDNHPEQYNP